MESKGKVLVTGVTGFLGSHTTIQLLERNYEVICTLRNLDRSDSIKEVIAKHTSKIGRLSFAEAELRDEQVWNKLNGEVPKLYILTKSLTEAALLNKIKDNEFLHFGSAKDKYLEFIRRYPDLALCVPLQYIASYLQVAPPSLSRIRREIT